MLSQRRGKRAAFCDNQPYNLGVLGAVFFLLVLRAQPARLIASTTRVVMTPTGLSPIKPQGGVGPGKTPWLKNFEAGRLTAEFTASDFTPQKDGSFLAQNPKAIYYMNRGQFMLVTGDSGTIFCDSSGAPPSNAVFSGPTGTPRNGSLHNVKISLFPSLTATQPTQTMETENIHFDNDTYRMYTETFIDPQGNTVDAKQVPVSIRGDEYEFDGNGLTMRWNAINHRLEKLQIYHGRRLEIKDPNKLTLPGMAAPEATKRVATADYPTVQLIVDKKPTPQIDPPTPYRAVFNNDVKITEPERTMALADVMTVDFLQGSSKASPAGTPAPVEAPSTEPVAANLPTSQPVDNLTAASATASTKPATTKPVNGPVTIYWSGELLVTPIKGEAMLPLAAGQSIVRLVGMPAVLTPEGSEVRAATVIYRNPDGAMALQNSAAFPVIHLKQGKNAALDDGASFDTHGVYYDPITQTATLTGPNELNVPVAQKKMNVTWDGQGVLHVIRVPAQPNGVDRIDLLGDVKVTHPMFTLDSNYLRLDLDLLPRPHANPTEADEQLKLLTATENVHCKLLHADKPAEGIDSDKLVIRTERASDKRTVPREVIADGSVHAFDPDQSITAGHLDAMLAAKANVAPATQPGADAVSSSVDLEKLDADTSVHAVLKSGATADSEKLRVTTVDGKKTVELWGPDGAKLDNQKGSWLHGDKGVIIMPDESGMQVTGPGQMQTIHNTATTRPVAAPPPKPINVAWTDSMSLDGNANAVDVHGNVKVANTDAVGTVTTMTGDYAHLDLMDSTKSTTKPAETQPDALGAATGSKQLKMLTLTGNVVGESQLRGADGNFVRQDTLHGNQLVYRAIDGTAIVPGEGWLLVENHKADAKAGANNVGKMAVSWKKQLIYTQATQIINIDGDTAVGFEKDPAEKITKSPPATPMQLRSQHLIITLAKAPGAKADQSKLQLSDLQAAGQVIFNAQGADFSCDKVDYNPKAGLLTATGHGRTLNADQTVSGTFDELIYDTVKEEILHVKNSQVKVQK